MIIGLYKKDGEIGNIYIYVFLSCVDYSGNNVSNNCRKLPFTVARYTDTYEFVFFICIFPGCSVK